MRMGDDNGEDPLFHEIVGQAHSLDDFGDHTLQRMDKCKASQEEGHAL